MLTGQSWPGQWALLVLAPRVHTDAAIGLASAALAIAVCDSDSDLRTAQWTQRLAAVSSLGGAGLAVLVEPRGTVAGAWLDAAPDQALRAAHAFWQQASGGG